MQKKMINPTNHDKINPSKSRNADDSANICGCFVEFSINAPPGIPVNT